MGKFVEEVFEVEESANPFVFRLLGSFCDEKGRTGENWSS